MSLDIFSTMDSIIDEGTIIKLIFNHYHRKNQEYINIKHNDCVEIKNVYFWNFIDIQ